MSDFDFEEDFGIPLAVLEAIGDTLTPEAIAVWWATPHEELGGSSPQTLWESGQRAQVLYLIVVASGRASHR